MKLLKQFTSVLAIFTMGSATAEMPKWSYDAGPDLKTKMGRELVDLTAEIPDMPSISKKITVKQKFRPAFGPIPWRMLQEPNKTKMLFIGQDGTHIAEAAGRPATAGFGGRAQDLANYFGVDEGAAFINTYAFTIKGQYGAYQTPYVYTSKDGEHFTSFGNLVDNKLWLMTQDLDSPIVKWRNKLIDWIIRNNKDSMRLVVTFGGAARDSIAAYVKSKGGDVQARHVHKMENIQVAETKLTFAGGNNEFPMVLDRRGRDLYSKVLGRKINYKSAKEQEAVKKSIKDNLQEYLKDMVFTKGGPLGNGLMDAAQLDGYDLDKAFILGVKTRSLKGITLDDGTTLENDVLFVELPHPSYLSRLSKSEASKAVGQKLKAIKKYVEAGWTIKADEGHTNKFAKGLDYAYSRADIGPEYYDFGTPGTRMVPVSTASRMSGNAHVIVFGTRDRAKFDMGKIGDMTEAQAAQKFSQDELFIARPRTEDLRYVFDAGPGEEYARLMKENLNLKEVFSRKEDMNWKNNGIDAYNVKNHPEIGDFGHYRGTFKKPQVVILADPQGYDDLITARAMTGTRGQYLQGLMNDLGVKDNHLVIKTVPFGMDGATEAEWKTVLEQTQEYRDRLINKVLDQNTPIMVMSDGPNAEAELKRILNERLGKNRRPVAHVWIRRDKESAENNAGIREAGNYAKRRFSAFRNAEVKGEMSNIPRSHLSFYARTWEGTSGDRVLNSSDKYKGLAFAEVAPKWAFRQQTTIKKNNEDSVYKLINKLKQNNLPLPGEKIPAYLKRTNTNPSISMILDAFFKELAA